MRTTLEIDDRILAIARSRAASEGSSVGRVISALALEGYEAGMRGDAGVDDLGLPTFAGVAGHVITSDAVAAARDDD